MTPKEKAEQLVDKYSTYVVMWSGGIETSKQNVKQYALIAVDGIINSNPIFVTSELEGKDEMHEAYLYWKEVRQEIEKL